MNKGKHTLLIIILVCVGLFVLFMVKMSDYITHMTGMEESAPKEADTVTVEIPEAVAEPQVPVLTTRDEKVGNVRVSVPKSWVSSQENDYALAVKDTADNASAIMWVRVEGSEERLLDTMQEKIEDGSIKGTLGDLIGKIQGDYTTEYYERGDIKGYLFRYSIEADKGSTLPCKIGILVSEEYNTCVLVAIVYKEEIEESSLEVFDECIDSMLILDVFEGPSENSDTEEGGAGFSEKDADGDGASDDGRDSKDADGENGDDPASEDEVDPDLKAFLDSYEEFMDEYVDFMKKYAADPANMVSMMTEYMEFMNRYVEFTDAIDKYDTKTMSKADAQYYIDVTARVSKKLLEIY
ncbi:MAG: hypothetical protein K5891_00235 [Lachnospiraceae bacterium]|nr:hypothetical protein [Lachnospiraceae bacterium]